METQTPKESPVEPQSQNYFKAKATEQANQLRIALIGISLGLCAFFAKELNRETAACQFPYLYGTITLSLLATAFGLTAWKLSARMFFAIGEGSRREIDHLGKNFCDIALQALLLLAVLAAIGHLLIERKPS